MRIYSLQCRAFTLVELLVVIAVVAVLAGLLMPALSAVRDTSRSSLCASNQRQIVSGMMLYCNENDGLFPFGQIDSGCVPAWMTPIITKSWTDQDRVGSYIDGSESLSGGYFLTTSHRRGVWCCPADPRKPPPYNASMTAISYGANCRLCDAVYAPSTAVDAEAMMRRPVPVSRVRSSASFVLIIDTQEARWLANNFPGGTNPPTLDYSNQELPTQFSGTSVQGPYSQFGRHRKAANGAFVDGHIQLLPNFKDDVLARRLFVRLQDM